MMNKIFFEKALEAKELSIDPNTKVGCVIVKDNIIVSKGYNTLPRGLQSCDYPLDCRKGAFLDTKYPYMIHSEAKAIVDAKCDLSNSVMYVTLFPCNECAKLIIEAGIKELYYLEDKYCNEDNVIASKRMLSEAGIKFEYIEI
ncbi:dCMP deaminase [Bacilli bacterium PM5-3]|nr:dCMP deaminase [Bacilli bacterium PM5-3]MDH6604342.1 dCMP deaminase [Bacilli bacterium PM5-9]